MPEARMTPSYRKLEVIGAYPLNAELCCLHRGPTLLAHLDQQLERSSPASLAFEALNGREPRAGDRLSYEDVARDQSAEFFAAFIDAWGRRLPGLACPLKLQNGELHFRTLGDESSEVWHQKTDARPQARWRAVQRDASGNDSGALKGKPAVPAVRFLGVMNGKHRCKASSDATTASDS